MSSQQFIQDLLIKADVQINGKRPRDIQVHNTNLYERILSDWSLGLGESYMDGWRDCDQLDEFFNKIIRAKLHEHIEISFSVGVQILTSKIINLQTKRRAKHDVSGHYNLGNDLFQAMLDKTMTYTCGYREHANNLDNAQADKLDLVCKKIGLQKWMRVLDIWCGWWSFAYHAATYYGASVIGVTLSEEQVTLWQERCKGLSVELRLQDYRDVKEQFDRIVSLGMIEHVWYKNYRQYMRVASQCLHKDGIFLLHTIGGNSSVTKTDPRLGKYIFPGSMLPSIKQLSQAFEGIFVVEDWHNIGAYYDPTLMAWYHNFQHNRNNLKQQYDKRFYRMRTYYLLCCAGSFRARMNQLRQIVLTKDGVIGGYKSVR